MLEQEGEQAYDPVAVWDRYRARHSMPLVVADGHGAVPFDEPTLAVLGMWMFGGGANPHFCLALGGLMERVDQRFIAWTAYSRALSFERKFWPDPAIHEQLVIHCLKQKAGLEADLGVPTSELEAQFKAELAHGEAYQQAYADYEAERLAAGADPTAPDFHDAFLAEHGSISSPVGKADTAYFSPDRQRSPTEPLHVVAMTLLLGGAGSWLGFISAWSRARKRRRR